MKSPSPLLAGVLALVVAGVGVVAMIAFNLVGGRLTLAGIALCLAVGGGVLGLWLKARPGLFKSGGQRTRDLASRRVDATVAAMVYVAAHDGAVAPEAAARIDAQAETLFGAPVLAQTREAMIARHADLLAWLKVVAPGLDTETKRDLVAACEAVAGDQPGDVADRLIAISEAVSFWPRPLLKPAT